MIGFRQCWYKKEDFETHFFIYEGEDKAENLSWRLRWYIGQEIGATLRYLHEECADGPIVHLSVCSSNIVFSHAASAMVSLQLWRFGFYFLKLFLKT